jgi:glutamate/tyrosine decarboxylase-like PLP-dependent enzyme
MTPSKPPAIAEETSLDPADWEAFANTAHQLLDQAMDRLRTARDGPVWRPVPEALKAGLAAPVPRDPEGSADVATALAGLLPYGVGNTHPRFFGWVHGSGAPGNLLSDITAAALNANCGGRDHAAIYVERQVVAWCRELFGFPQTGSGLVVSGTSMATLIALKTARDAALDFTSRDQGLGPSVLVGYAARSAHSCIARTFDLLGLGTDALRRIETDADGRMNLDALACQIRRDRDAGLQPAMLVGTAGTVDIGAIDDLSALADIAAEQGLWLHVDGAFGACAILSDELRPRLAGIERAQSLAFDFHKWLHVNYDAGCVLIRDGALHRRAFAVTPDYLSQEVRGLAAGAPWPVDFGPELSRGARAIRVWAHLKEHGTRRLGQMIGRNCEQAAYLADRVDATPELERLAPVALNIVCFRATRPEGEAGALDQLNRDIVIALQESGLAAPSTTRIGGVLAIRVNLTNHRTRRQDLDLLVEATVHLARELTAG